MERDELLLMLKETIDKLEYDSTLIKPVLISPREFLQPIYDDIKWLITMNDTVGGVQLDYAYGSINIDNNILDVVISNKVLELYMTMLPIEPPTHYKYYPYKFEPRIKECDSDEIH